MFITLGKRSTLLLKSVSNTEKNITQDKCTSLLLKRVNYTEKDILRIENVQAY